MADGLYSGVLLFPAYSFWVAYITISLRSHGLLDILDFSSWVVSRMGLVLFGGIFGEFDVEQGVLISLSLLVLLIFKHGEMDAL